MVAQHNPSEYYTVYPGSKKMFEAPIVELFVAYTNIPEEKTAERQDMANKIAEYYKKFNEKVAELKERGISATDDIAKTELQQFTKDLRLNILEGRNVNGINRIDVQKLASFAGVASENENTSEEISNVGKEQRMNKKSGLEV